MCVNWQGDEYGAPEINPKRPYGNSDVEDDIHYLLFAEYPSEEDPANEEDLEYIRKIHKETEQALQIVLRTGKFETGIYECEEYTDNWVKV